MALDASAPLSCRWRYLPRRTPVCPPGLRLPALSSVPESGELPSELLPAAAHAFLPPALTGVSICEVEGCMWLWVAHRRLINQSINQSINH